MAFDGAIVTPEALDARTDRRERSLVAFEGHAEHRGDRFGRQIIGGRTEAAGANQDLVGGAEAPECRLDPRRVIVGAIERCHFQTEPGQRVRQPGGIGVDELAASELGADAENGSGHRGREV